MWLTFVDDTTGGYGGHGGGGVRTGGQGGIGGGPLLTNVTIIQSSESGTKNGKGLQAENQEAYLLKDALGVLHNSVKFDGLFRTQQYTLFTWKAGQRQEHPDTYTWPKLLHAWNTRKFDTPIEFETPIAFIESSIPLHPSPLDTLKFPPPLHETGVSINQTADAIILPVLQPIPTESRLLATPKAEAIVNAAADSDSDSDSEGTFHDASDGIVPESLPNDSAVDLPAALPAESVRESSPLPAKSTHAAKSTHGPEVLGKTLYILSPSENATRHASVAPIATSTIIPPPPTSTLPHPRLPHMLSPPDIATKHPSAAPIVTSAVNHPPTPTPSHPRPPHKEIRDDPVTAPQKGVGWFAKVKKWFIK
ncbi:hypothetical protein C8R43DRAFT_1136628 [Mycena crocata]|nr:hypothetical protein C8R43DRAFT_1136628 [Mycena crocata]